MLKSNVATFPSMLKSEIATLQRGVQIKVYQCRDIEIQRRDVTKALGFGFFQRRDVEIERRGITERVKFPE